MVVWVSEGVGPLDGKAGPGRVTTSLRARTLALSTTAVGDVAPGSDGADPLLVNLPGTIVSECVVMLSARLTTKRGRAEG